LRGRGFCLGQRKLKARKMLENRGDSHPLGARCVGRHLTLVWQSDPCLPFPRHDRACERRCAVSGTAAATCRPIYPVSGSPGLRGNRHRDALSAPRPSASHRRGCARQAPSPSPARWQRYDGRFGPDLALRRADPSVVQPTRATAHRRKTPSKPASAPAHAPMLHPTWLPGRCPKMRTRYPRSRLSLCPDNPKSIEKGF